MVLTATTGLNSFRPRGDPLVAKAINAAETSPLPNEWSKLIAHSLFRAYPYVGWRENILSSLWV